MSLDFLTVVAVWVIAIVVVLWNKKARWNTSSLRNKKHEEPKMSPVLGVIAFEPEWRCYVGHIQIDGENIPVEMLGTEVDRSIAYAETLVAGRNVFKKDLQQFLTHEAEEKPEPMSEEIRQLKVKVISVFSDSRASWVMVYFTEPFDEQRSWRCNYTEDGFEDLNFDS